LEAASPIRLPSGKWQAAVSSGMSKYRHNHYAPEWYQRRFMRPGQNRYWRLDLYPEKVFRQKTRRAVHNWSPERVFAQDDLYTTKWGEIINTDIERFFFREFDGPSTARALDFFVSYNHLNFEEGALNVLLPYMSVQKLRTPKGLADLTERSRNNDRNYALLLLQEIQNLYCAIWTEAVWQIADASNSPTKFIISDHPVTVYNRACPWLSDYCRGHRDPDIRLHGTHTYFPLSLDKVLILTNLSWVRDPYQNECGVRPNREMLRTTMFSFADIQTDRLLSEDEVLQINYITKRRAYRYIAAAEEEWLYPERRVSTDHWRKLGGGYLLMPEPRLIHMGGEIFIGYKDGRKDAFGPYGHKPWQKGYKNEQREARESEMLERFKAEWAGIHGSRYTAVNRSFGGRSIRESGDEMMKHFAGVRKEYRRKS
jgi:uncharacterized protein DUF4238